MENNQKEPLDFEFASAALRAGNSRAGGDTDFPGQPNPEVEPGKQGDFDHPGRGAPEQQPGQGDTDQPGETKAEVPDQPIMPGETPPPD